MSSERSGGSVKKTMNIENHYRCTEITCMYSSVEELREEVNNNLDNCQSERNIKDILETKFNDEKEIIVELENETNSIKGLNDVKAVELVIAVQSAIKQRQAIIDEWKIKSLQLNDKIEKLQREKICLEKCNITKDTELECVSKRLHELNKIYHNLLNECNILKSELIDSKNENEKLTGIYNKLVYEVKDIKSKLLESLKNEQEIEKRLKDKIDENINSANKIDKIENELRECRRTIKQLTCSLEVTTKELCEIKHTLDEYKNIECKLNNIRNRNKILKENYNNLEIKFDKIVEESSSYKEMISRLNLCIENMNNDKNELIVAIKYINDEKEILLKKNQSLTKELYIAKENFSEIQTKLNIVKSDVEGLKVRIEDLTKYNKDLSKELKHVKCENNKLNANLHTTVKECVTLSKALTEAQNELEIEQKNLQKMECKIKYMENEKKELEYKLENLVNEKQNLIHDVNCLDHENKEYRTQNNELSSKLYIVSKELEESMKEITRFNNEIDSLKNIIKNEREKYELNLSKLQDKIRIKSHEWKEYVTKEIQRLRDKRRSDIKKYLELNKDLENRLESCQNNHKKVEEELLLNITELKKQLEVSRRKLDQVIEENNVSRAELIEKNKEELSKLYETLNRQKLENEWLVVELENRIQSLVQKNLDDETTIHILKKESLIMKERLKGYEEEKKKSHELENKVKVLNDIKVNLEADLNNTKNLLQLAEEMSKNKNDENLELIEKLKNEQEHTKDLNVKIHKLKKIIGKRDAQIDVLNNTINQLKINIQDMTNENMTLKCSINELEEKQVKLSDKIKDLTKELNESKRLLQEVGDDKKNLITIIKSIEKEIKVLEKENICLKEELTCAKENEYSKDKALENSLNVQVELKDKLLKSEINYNKSKEDLKIMEEKLCKMTKSMELLEKEIFKITEIYRSNENSMKHKIDQLEKQAINDNDEINRLKTLINESDINSNRLRQKLCESEKSLKLLIKIFDNLRITLCEILNIKYTSDFIKNFQSSDNYRDIINIFQNESEIFIKSLKELKKHENDLSSKLCIIKRDFEKLSIVMKQLQCDYSIKVEKMSKEISDKDDVIKNLEKQMVKIQLDAANADEILAMTLKDKIQQQQNLINKLQDEKNILQSEILCFAKKVNDLENEIYNIIEKIKSLENKNSKLQLKNVSLQNDIEKLSLLLNDARDKENQQIVQYKQMLNANRELMEKIRLLKCELAQSNRDLDQIKSSYESLEQTKCCITTSSTNNKNHEKELIHEVKTLTDKLRQSQKSEQDARLALNNMEKNLIQLKKQLNSAEDEKSNLEGWVGHLQKLISGGYIADSSLPAQLDKAKQDKKALQNTIDNLRLNLNSLHEEKTHLVNTVQHLTKCNANLENTISTLAKNKHNINEQFQQVQQQVDYIQSNVIHNQSDVTKCSLQVNQLLKKATEVSQSLKDSTPSSSNSSLITSQITDINNDHRRITTGIKKITPFQTKISTDNNIPSSSTVDCHTCTTHTDITATTCCVIPINGNDNNNQCQHQSPCKDCCQMEIRHNEISDIQPNKSKKRATAQKDKNTITFV